MTPSIDEVEKRPRVQGKNISGDQQGCIHRTETRTVFWRVLQQDPECEKILADLLNVAAAHQAFAEWPDFAAANPHASGTLSGLAEQGWFPYLGGWLDHDRFPCQQATLGPLWQWPFGHALDWCNEHDLESPSLVIDAVHTLTQNIRIHEIDRDGSVGCWCWPVLDPDEIPAQVNVCRLEAEVAAESMEGRGYYNWIGSEVYSENELEDFTVEFGNLVYDPNMSWDETQKYVKAVSMEIAKHMAGRALSRRRFKLAKRRAKYTVPADEHMHWFIRMRVKGETIAAVADDQCIDKSERHVAEVKSNITGWLDLPEARPPTQRASPQNRAR